MGIGTLTNIGLTEMLTAQAGNLAFKFDSAKISSILVPISADLTALTSIVYTCSAGQVHQTVLDQNTIRTIIALDTTVGDFTIGTIGLYTGSGTLFAAAQFPSAGSKLANNPPLQVGNLRSFYVDVVYKGIAAIPTLTSSYVTMRQLRTALNGLGLLTSATTALTGASPTSQASINWFSGAQNNALGDSLFTLLVSALSLSDGGVALFAAARAVTPP